MPNVTVIPPTAGTRQVDIIQRYVDPMLHAWSRIKIWDELARVVDEDAGVYEVSYKHWDDEFTPEVFRNDHQQLAAADFTIDGDLAQLTIINSSLLGEGTDFFVTYQYNYFAELDLTNYIDLALNLINMSSERETYLTAFVIDDAPVDWDGVMALFAYQRALETLLVDSLIWKNYLIFQDGAAAQGILEGEISRSREMFDQLRLSVKREHHVSQPTSSYDFFRQTGIGIYAAGATRRLRGFRANRVGIFTTGA